MSNNPIVHHEYLEIVTPEDLVSALPSDRANKVVVTSASGVIPTILIPSQINVSSITVGANTVVGSVSFLTPSGSALTISADSNTNTISFSTTAVSSVNNLAAGITIEGINNIFIYTDTSANKIQVSDDMIRPASNDTEISQIIQEFTTDPSTGRVLTTTKKEVRGATTTTVKTVAFTYDSKGRLTVQTVTFPGGRVITTTYSYPPSGSGLPEEIPLSYTKTIV